MSAVKLKDSLEFFDAVAVESELELTTIVRRRIVFIFGSLLIFLARLEDQ